MVTVVMVCGHRNRKQMFFAGQKDLLVGESNYLLLSYILVIDLHLSFPCF